MTPESPLKLREALLSMLAGNIFLRTRLAVRLLVLKGIYYFLSALQLRKSWTAWRKRQRATHEPGIGTTSA
jgi:hypothetical protein